ncbi:hypothetical protein CCAX7_52540 [Capsulimonas corticalis]|uniref:Uncharacterized protein n=1 Tax=Capsulimonas corticalis TaxID=2219043 RepID=A0A402CP39_9BACT|nr:hypothetical protein [Capsulimonas corticalis]BDI33203.1 hypothetical protein CCAX7_52540 [Capsulimonas corticalis]
MRPHLPLLTLTMALIASAPATAQSPPGALPPVATPGVPATPTAPPVAPRLRLREALAFAKIAPTDTIFAIAPGQHIPTGAVPSVPGDSLTQVMTAFGRSKAEFGSLIALGPLTMTEFNDAPSDADIYAGMDPRQILVLLAASLDQDQWTKLTTGRGIADVDLTTNEQHAMWSAMLLHKNYETVGRVTHEVHEISDQEMQGAHLRLGSEWSMMLTSLKSDSSSISSGSLAEILDPAYRDIMTRSSPADKTALSASVRREIPNNPKTSDLDFTGKALNATVDITGLNTVGQLIDRIRQATRMEIYADQRYEQISFMVTGPTSVLKARDLLRALAFGIASTYRGVGPAYVLTADLTGAGMRTQTWWEYEQDVEKLRAKPLTAASEKIHKLHGDTVLPAFGDGVPLTDEQIKALGQPIENLNLVSLPMGKLTPSQQAAAKQLAADLKREPRYGGQAPYQANLAGDVIFGGSPMVWITFPSDLRPLKMGMLAPSQYDLYHQSLETEMANISQEFTHDKADQDAKRDPNAAAHLKTLLPAAPRRALLCRLQSPQDAGAVVTSMMRLGLNELWVAAFYDGEAHPESVKAAVHAAAGKGIAIYPVMDVLKWGQSAPDAAKDWTILGEDSLQSNLHWRRRNEDDIASMNRVLEIAKKFGLDFSMPEMGYQEIFVSPFSREAATRLTTAAKSLAAQPGIAGLVWRTTEAPGYNRQRPDDLEFFSRLGYTLPARLAFLRKAHLDPIDLKPLDLNLQAQTIPEVWSQGYVANNSAFEKQWPDFLNDANIQLLRAMRAAIDHETPAGRLPQPILLRKRPDYTSSLHPDLEWYGSWDSSALPPPFLLTDQNYDDPIPKAPPTAAEQARAQSKDTLFTVTPSNIPDDAKLIELLKDRLTEMANGKSAWRGFVLDVSQLKESNPIDKAANEFLKKP